MREAHYSSSYVYQTLLLSCFFPTHSGLGGKRYVIKSSLSRDFPGGPTVRNPPAGVGDMGSIPGLGTKIPHAPGQLSLRTTAAEPHAWIPCSATGEASAIQSLCTAAREELPLAATRESVQAATKTQHRHKYIHGPSSPPTHWEGDYLLNSFDAPASKAW